MDNLFEHKFCKYCLENNRSWIEKLKDLEWVAKLNSDGYFRLSNPPKFDDLLAYHVDVFQYMTNLLNSVERLSHIEVYINKFPCPKTYEKNGITEDRWIKYHYSNYNATQVTIFDTAILLVNEVLILGLDPKECNERTVLKNTKVEFTKTGKALKKLKGVTEKYRKPRNLAAHRGQEIELGSLQLPSVLSLLQRAGAPMVEINILDKIYKLTRRGIVYDLHSQTLKVTDNISHLFDALFEHYELQTRVYQIETKSI
jgi:hypothetical protein